MGDVAFPIRHILVAHDFSETAAQALELGLALARKLDARVTILHACEVVSYAYADSIVSSAELLEEARRAAQSAVDGIAEGARRTGLVVLSEVRIGPPRSVIVDFAREAKVDLVVLGTHGRKGIPRALVGSVAERVVRMAPCPVLTVHGTVASP
jgi:nucleotide-binding universal stress UspA family protein